ncbi:T9SS type A sorting domain-containing protein [Cytophagaceae bacterium ABcell3]|nr:T9SS type A sorting domain-containing protein [Cytophagaceae bacterium ABcell3]
MKNIFIATAFIFTFSLPGVSQTLTPGVHSTYILDDFGSTEPYPGLYWFGDTNDDHYTISRAGDNRLTIDCKAASPQHDVFGAALFDNENRSHIDIYDNPIIKVTFENPSDDELIISPMIKDINDKEIRANADQEVFELTLPPGEHEFELDLTDGYVVNWTNCTTCPDIHQDYDLTKIHSILFTVNGGAGKDNDLEPYTGLLYIKSLQIGDLPCTGIPGDIFGGATVCQDSLGYAYSIEPVEGATSYEWTVPEGASIMYGEGTNQVIVNFGTSSGDITVTPVAECGSGRKVTLPITVEAPVEAIDEIIVDTEPCAFTEVEATFDASNLTNIFTWSLSNSAEIFTNEDSTRASFTIGMEETTIHLSVTNSCITEKSLSKTIYPQSAPEKPEITKDSLTLSATSAPNYRWYRNNILLEDQTSKVLEAKGPGSYVVEVGDSITGCWTASDPTFITISHINGRTATYVRDDFAYPEPHVNTDGGGVFWWSRNENVYQINRKGEGVMEISAKNADPNWKSFGVSWGSDEDNQPYTVDLSQNAVLKFTIENPTDQELLLTALITDIEDNQAQVTADTSAEKELAQVKVPANGTNELFIDLTGGYTTEWKCEQNPYECPKLTSDFLWKKVTGAIFQINAEHVSDLPPFTGTIIMRDFQLGNFISQEDFELRTISAKAYQWFKDDKEISSATGRNFTVEGSGTYKVKITDIDGSEYMSHPHEVDVVSALTPETTVDLTLFPNPTNDKVTIDYKGEVKHVHVMNMHGAHVLSSTEKEISLNGLTSGVYTIKITTDKGSVVKKLIKQ